MSVIIFHQLSKRFTMKMIDSVAEQSSLPLIWRVHLENPEHAHSFIKAYGEAENSTYISYNQNSHPKRYVMKKTWICQHSKLGKRNNSRRNADCQVHITILIKIVNKWTSKNDPLLKQTPPLNSIVTVENSHTHNLHTADSLRMLRVSSEIKEVFEGYFKKGMSGSEAKKLHENNLMLNENSLENIANASINPTDNQVGYLYHVWRNANLAIPKQHSLDCSDDVIQQCSSRQLNEGQDNFEENLKTMDDAYKKFRSKINSLETVNFMTKFFQMNTNRISRGKKIPVQPTSISRRRIGVYRGSGRVNSGRPRKKLV